MSEYQQSKKHMRKSYKDLSYQELLDYFSSAGKKTATVFVPMLCEALKKENPDFTNTMIKERVIIDSIKAGWSRSQITEVLATATDIVDDDPVHIRQIKAYKTRNARKLELIAKTAIGMNQVDLPPAPQPKEKQEKWTKVPDEETDALLHKHGLGRFGESNKTISDLRDEILDHAAGLFTALSQKDPPIGIDEDLMNEYIKSTREDFKSLMFELSQEDRASIHNRLVHVIEMAEDRLEVINKVDKK